MRDMRHLWHDLQSFYRLQKGAIFIDGVDGAGQQAYTQTNPMPLFLANKLQFSNGGTYNRISMDGHFCSVSNHLAILVITKEGHFAGFSEARIKTYKNNPTLFFS